VTVAQEAAESFLAELEAKRPEITADTPFAEVLDKLTDAVLAVARVADAVKFNPADFTEEFGLRDNDEQTDLGVAVALGALTIRGLTSEIAGGVADAFETVDGK